MTLKEAKEYLKEKLLAHGFIIQEYDAYSTNSVYLKMDYGVCNSIRISDHEGKKYLKYRFNVMIPTKKNGLNKNIKIQQHRENLPMFYYPLTQDGLDYLLGDIIKLRKTKFKDPNDYTNLLNRYRAEGKRAKGFWTQAIETPPDEFTKRMIWGNLMGNRSLECSSAGDKRFSAKFAYVTVFGKNRTIEDHYQAAKCMEDGQVAGKGKAFHHLDIQGVVADTKYATAFYKMLWYKYLKANPELVSYASMYNNFTDKFRGKNTVNCQADVIRQYVKEGPSSIKNDPDVVELTSIFNTYRAGLAPKK